MSLGNYMLPPFSLNTGIIWLNFKSNIDYYPKSEFVLLKL